VLLVGCDCYPVVYKISTLAIGRRTE